MLSEVTSHWGSTFFRSGKARTGTLGLWECAELACRDCQVWGTSCACVCGGVGRVSFYKEGLNVWDGHSGEGFFFFLITQRRVWRLCAGPRSAPRSTPCGHTKNGVMKERSENWISLLLLLHIRSVPVQVPARDASTGRTVIGVPLTGGEDRKRYTGRLGKIALTRRLKCTFIFTLRASVGLISCGLDLLRNLTDDSHVLDCFTLDLGSINFPPVFFPLLSFSLICLSIFQLSPSLPFLFTHIHLSSCPLSLSVTQGQRHEESTGFPTEEERVSRKQPSWQDRQIHEVSQVSGHFLAACVCVCVRGGGGSGVFVCGCIPDRFSSQLAMTRPLKPDTRAVTLVGACGMCVKKKKEYLPLARQEKG